MLVDKSKVFVNDFADRKLHIGDNVRKIHKTYTGRTYVRDTQYTVVDISGYYAYISCNGTTSWAEDPNKLLLITND